MTSPTETVAGAVRQGFEKVKHSVRQWSLNDIFSEEELVAFDTRVRRFLKEEGAISYIAEDKIDGVKIILTYTNGNLTLAATRGDGMVGENVTKNMRLVSNIPKTIQVKDTLVVEGEIFMDVGRI